MSKFTLLWVLLFGLGTVYAQDSAQYILAGKVLDVHTGMIRENVLITIRGSRISELQSDPDLSRITHYRDLSEYTILPGLIDCHTHLVGDWYKDDFDVYTLPAATFGIIGTVNARKTLQAGFTTVRDVHSYYYGDVALRDAINKGIIPGPRMFVSGPALTITGGHGAFGNWLSPQLEFVGNPVSVADGEDEVRKETRKHLKYQVDWIKIFATGGFGSFGTEPGAASYTVEELTAAVDEARKRGVDVAAHAHGKEGILNALNAGVRSVEHGTFLDEECIRLFKEKNAFLIMDVKAAYYDYVESKLNENGEQIATDEDHSAFREYLSRLKLAYDAGVSIAFGSDAGIYPHGDNAKQFILMREAGMSELDILKSATITAAKLLKKEHELGSVEKGKQADLIAVKGNPLENIRMLEEVYFVMKDGEVYRDVSADN